MTDEVERPTELPPDWALDMAQLRYDPMEDRAAFNMTTSGPSPMSPRDPAEVSPPPRPSSVGTPIQPPPGIALIDRICIAADQRERMAAQTPDVMQFMMTMQRQQTQILAALAALVSRMEGQKSKKAPEPKHD